MIQTLQESSLFWVMKKIWIVAVALVIVGFAGLYIGYATRPLSGTGAGNSSASIRSSSPRAADLSATMRTLLEDNIVWTRMYLIDLASNNGFKEADATRLLKTQEAIGDAFKPYYGNGAGDMLTELLKQNTLGMVAFAEATQIQDTAAQNKANTDWYSNANKIADFLARANHNWSSTDMRFMMKSYVDMTKQQAIDILGNKYEASITDYDTTQKKILQTADTISIGIRQQFPERF